MQHTKDSAGATMEPLEHVRGLRLWVDDPADFPQAVAELARAANDQALTPILILFETCEASWSVSLLGE